jgi:cytochrome c553
MSSSKVISAGFARALGVGVVMFAMAVPALAAGNVAAGKAKSAACAACHGVDGNGGGDPSWPKLAGQHENYLLAQLKAFKSGARQDALMSPMVAGLSDKDMANLAAYYAAQELKPGAARDKDLATKGGRIYRGGNAKTGVSACMSCHGPSGHGIPPNFPKISGQNAAYTEKALLAFKSSKRPSDSDIMTRIAFRMSEAEIKAVSEYMAGLH